ncbi:hypothetical protein BY996DRAFT_8503234 [Phakopsora pachyrhizi]|uniref:Uncharacterized protein n=1 Tax=Phakopsora pachyrhizi TaxID=170000 RepID=A0AAV0B8N3_PHAPC|nr:hypothetical protein BY996DRAFT_8503234 [Phakopsora pachyrhizi]CAH7682396.1 hypothetical protein PPACK8108_LOCUS15300 [Phakopsora pachyrhizi]
MSPERILYTEKRLRPESSMTSETDLKQVKTNAVLGTEGSFIPLSTGEKFVDTDQKNSPRSSMCLFMKSKTGMSTTQEPAPKDLSLKENTILSGIDCATNKEDNCLGAQEHRKSRKKKHAKSSKDTIKSIIEILSVNMKNSGPFDLAGERKFCSPYNRDLFQFIEKNLKDITPEEFSDYEINPTFFKSIITYFWNENEGIFQTSDNSINDAKNIEYNFSRCKKGNQKDNMPLKNEELLRKQDDAFDFFCELHQDAERLYAISRRPDAYRKYNHINNVDLGFEELRQHTMNEISASYLTHDQETWLYIELWMIKFRPKLYKVALGHAYDGNLETRNKFKSLINRTFFVLFSGMVKFGNLRDS